MQIAFLIFDRLTALDAIGPYEVLSRVPGAEVVFAAQRTGEIVTDSGALRLVATHRIDEVAHPDILVVPGGPGQADQMQNEDVLDWIRSADGSSVWTTSVCTGSLILGAAGLLKGKRATSHWLALDELRRYGAAPIAERVVVDGKLITAAGVSSGIDMALRLVSLEFGDEVAQTIQLSIEYDPQPPFDTGSPDKAPVEVVSALRARSRFTSPT